MMDSIIIAVILIAVIGLASFYIYKVKKNGKKCIGCPADGTCGGCCGCHGLGEDAKKK